jgi:hypothetical protein
MPASRTKKGRRRNLRRPGHNPVRRDYSVTIRGIVAGCFFASLA